MNFEGELRRSVDELADHLRDEIARRLETITTDLQATVQAERKAAGAEAARVATETAEREAAQRLNAAVAEAEARAREAGRTEGWAAGLEDGRAEGRETGFAAGLASGRDQGFAEGQAKGREEAGVQDGASGKESLDRLTEAVRSMDGARSLSEVLDILARAASREATRTGVLIVKGEDLQSWRFNGFGAVVDEASPFTIPLSDGGVIATAVRGAATASADSTDQTLQPGFASLPSGRTMLAVPLTMSGQVIAVLYGDQGQQEGVGSASPAALEMLARHAARSLEAVTAFRAAKLLVGSQPES